jgi:hypothetical protein
MIEFQGLTVGFVHQFSNGELVSGHGSEHVKLLGNLR